MFTNSVAPTAGSTAAGVVETIEIVCREDLQAATMRRVGQALDAGPASR